MEILKQSGELAACGVFLVVAACGGGTSGPCEHRDEDAVVTIASVRGAASGQAVANFEVSQVRFNDQALPDLRYLVVGVPNSGASVSGGSLRCSGSCGFGTQEGVYEFVVSAPGFAPRQVRMTAVYARKKLGCPSSFSGGTRVDVTLPLGT
jgi:hypothetical protein